jgi:hypothetical protein
MGNGLPGFDLKVVKLKLADGEHDDCLTSYVNGRVDLERKSGNIAKLDYGKLSAAVAKKASADPLAIMKGKKETRKVKDDLPRSLWFKVRSSAGSCSAPR